MRPLLRTLLVALAGVALLVPAIGAAAVREEPPVTTPAETTPLPPDPVPPQEPGVTVEIPPEPQTITLQVPMAPEPAVAPKRTVARPDTHARRVTYPRVARVAEPESPSRADVTPVAKAKAKVKPKPRKKARHAQRHAIAPVSALQPQIRAPGPAHGVLAAQYSAPTGFAPATTHRTVLYLALGLAAALGMLFGAVGAAPVLAGRWPQVFVPVIDATERIVLAGVCLAGAALTLAITWALTGPGV